MQKGWMVENPNVKENKKGRSNLLKILTNQPWATPPALGSSRGYKDQPEANIGNNLRKKKGKEKQHCKATNTIIKTHETKLY